MFSSSGRDTSSWVHTGDMGKGRRLDPSMPSATERGTGNRLGEDYDTWLMKIHKAPSIVPGIRQV